MSFSLDTWLKDRAVEVEQWLKQWIEGLKEDKDVAPALSSAMEYALLGGGKRLRPGLVFASAYAIDSERAGTPGSRSPIIRDACCAIELLHNYSLIHDDLPSMDDDDLRRGRPTCHKVHGEGMAVLAGDALLTDAFALLASGPNSPQETEGFDEMEASTRLRLVARLAQAAGSAGMASGQAMDIARTAVGKGLEEVEQVHLLKTGALFSFSCAAGAEAVGADRQRVESMARFGRTVGLAFQIADDVLDETGDAAALGKRVGKDRDRDTATVTRAIGLEDARKKADSLVDEALSLVADLGAGAEPIRALAIRLVRRNF